MFPITEKPVNWFAMQLTWLVSLWWGKFVVNGSSGPINILNCCNQSQFFNCLVIKIFAWSFSQLSIQNIPTNTPRGFHVEMTWKQPFPRRFNVDSTWCVCRDILATICIVTKEKNEFKFFLILQFHSKM